MRICVFRWFLAGTIYGVLTGAQVAYSEPAPDKAYVDKIWHGTYDVEADGRVAETVEHRFQVLQAGQLERYKVYNFSYSTSIQTGEVLEAYTLKTDGRRVPVPTGNYQRQVNEGRKGAGPAFSDRTRVSVVFPDLTVGDSVHIRYKLVDREPMFPGQYSLALRFSPYVVYEDARVTVRVPSGMALKSEAHHFKPQQVRDDNGKRVLEWRYASTRPRVYDAEADDGLWTVNESPSVFVSTFSSYEAIAAAYGQRATPKAQPTERIRALVRDVLQGEMQPREKARMLYEWVSKNITYGGNCIGVGAVVPRDVDTVLDNKMGDCKDHATLLQAMLSAAGVGSEQVLINAGSQYDLAETPTVSMVNHVMNYLPEFKLYVDATAKDIPFGYLPSSAYAKPVIHVAARPSVARVPNARHELNKQHMRMSLKLASNGSATGSLSVSLKGAEAAGARAYLRELSGDDEKDLVKHWLASGGLRGQGKIVKNDTGGLSDQYEFSVSFEIDNYLRGGATGAFYVAPVISLPYSIMSFADMLDAPKPKRLQPCHGFYSHETYDIELPSNLTLISMPDDAQVRASLVDYIARHEKTPAGLRITRELHDKTVDSICSVQTGTELIHQSAPVAENLRTQFLYKRLPR